MSAKLRILILEDVPSDAELMEYELTESGLSFVSKRVATKESFVKACDEYRPDIILSDYSLPSFDGLTAMKFAFETCPDVPYIFVSGALGEEMAIDLLKRGATDYVLKNKLSRLGPAVSRALLEVKERKELKRFEKELKESEIKYRTIFENTGTATIIVSEEDTIVLANRMFEKLTGYLRSEIEGKKYWQELMIEDDIVKADDPRTPEGSHFKIPTADYELRLMNKNGDIRNVLVNFAPIPTTDRTVISLRDITERKTAEEALKKREQELEMKSQSLGDANTASKVLLKHREEYKTTLEEQVLLNVGKLVLPYLDKLKQLKLNETQMAQVETIESHLHAIVSPFLRTLSSKYLNLTPREIQVASLVKDGKTTKEIMEVINISAAAVDFHRKNIRLKLGIKNAKANLRSYLFTLSS